MINAVKFGVLLGVVYHKSIEIFGRLDFLVEYEISTRYPQDRTKVIGFALREQGS